jgi:transcriptional regulator with XRE-family HTH domain
MTELIKQVADRIKGLREIAGKSVETMAKNTGISTTQYSEYESGKIDIPISILFKISQLLNVDLSALLSGENPKLHIYCLVRKGKGLSVERRKQFKYENLAFNFINRKVEPFFVTVDPEPENSPFLFNSHPGQEFNYIIEGSVKIIIDTHEIVLNEGDSLYFDSGYQHAMKAINNKSAKLLAIVL